MVCTDLHVASHSRGPARPGPARRPARPGPAALLTWRARTRPAARRSRRRHHPRCRPCQRPPPRARRAHFYQHNYENRARGTPRGAPRPPLWDAAALAPTPLSHEHQRTMTTTMDLDQGSALLHFTRNGAFGPGATELLVLERGEGPYVFDTHGRRYVDGLSQPVLRADRLLLRRGDGHRRRRAALQARLQHAVGHGPPGGARSSPTGWPTSRLRGSTGSSSPPAARSPSRRRGRSCASTTSPTASPSG